MGDESPAASNAAPVTLESLGNTMNNFISEIRNTLQFIKTDLSEIKSKTESNTENLIKQDSRISLSETEIIGIKERIRFLEDDLANTNLQRKFLTIEGNNKEQRLRAHTLKFVGHTPKDSSGNIITNSAELRKYFTSFLQTGFDSAISNNVLPSGCNFSSTYCIDESHPLNPKPKPSYAEVTSSNNNLDDTIPAPDSVVKVNKYCYIINFTNRHIANAIYGARKEIISSLPTSQDKLQIKRDLTKVNREAMSFLHESSLVASYENSDVKRVKLQSSKVWFCRIEDPKVWLPVHDPFARDLTTMTTTVPLPST